MSSGEFRCSATVPLLQLFVLCLLSFSWSEQVSNLLLRTTDELIKNLRSVDNLWLIAIECFGNLTGNERLTSAWWSIQKHAFAMLRQGFPIRFRDFAT